MIFSKAKILENWFKFNYVQLVLNIFFFAAIKVHTLHFQIFLEKAHSNLPSTLKHFQKHFIGDTYVTKKKKKKFDFYTAFLEVMTLNQNSVHH
jgi:hypothetical protein